MNSRGTLERLLANWPAKIISLAAAFILFIFYRVNTMQERFFSVPLEVSPPPGLAIAETYPQNVRVTLRGEVTGIYPILEQDIQARVDFGPFHTEGTFRLPVKVERRGSALDVEPLAVRVEPAEITFKLERQIERSLEVVPNVVGTPVHGFELVQQSVSPNVVKVRGPRSQLANLKSLATEEIDLTGRTEDFSATARISVGSPLIQLPGGRTVEFHGAIREAIGIRSFEGIDIITIDLAAGLRPDSELPRGSIKLQGSQTAVESLLPDRVRLVVDCSEIELPGAYPLETRPDIPAGYIVLKYEPQRIELTVLPAETGRFTAGAEGGMR